MSRPALLETLRACKHPLFIAGTDTNFTPLTGLVGTDYTLAPFSQCRLRAETLIKLAQDERWKRQALEPLYLKPARFELVVPK